MIYLKLYPPSAIILYNMLICAEALWYNMPLFQISNLYNTLLLIKFNFDMIESPFYWLIKISGPIKYCFSSLWLPKLSIKDSASLWTCMNSQRLRTSLNRVFSFADWLKKNESCSKNKLAYFNLNRINKSFSENLIKMFNSDTFLIILCIWYKKWNWNMYYYYMCRLSHGRLFQWTWMHSIW